MPLYDAMTPLLTQIGTVWQLHAQIELTCQQVEMVGSHCEEYLRTKPVIGLIVCPEALRRVLHQQCLEFSIAERTL